MARTLEGVQAEDLAGEGNMLEAEGVYHLFVDKIVDGFMADGETEISGLGVKVHVVGGEEDGKTLNLILNDGNYSHKDGGKFARRKQAAFLLAANVLQPKHLQGGDVTYDEQVAAGSHIVAELRLGDPSKKNNKRYLDIHFTNVWHVDDPRVPKDAVLCKESIAGIPAEYRHDEAYFAPLLKKKSAPKPSSFSEDDVEL